MLNGTWKKQRISQKLAQRVMQLAEEQGFAVNLQTSLIWRERPNIVGMIVPKYDNRYFGEIAERFESRARARGLFPVVTCTQRDPDMEFETAKALVSYQAECLISTGATDPNRISAFCKASGVQSINLDLPDKDAPSVISDNFTAARDLATLILDRCKKDLDWSGPLRFIGGRLSDHNTVARLEGWQCQLAIGTGWVRYGCFDWDPFGYFLPGNVGMAEHDVSTMLTKTFDLIGEPTASTERILVPCILRAF